MHQLTIIPHGDSAAVVLPAAILERIGLGIGDVLEATLSERQLVLKPANDAARKQLLDQLTREVFEQRQDAYRRLA